VSARVAIVAGASGATGKRLATWLAGLDGWEVIGLSRKPTPGAPFRYLSVDLTSVTETRAALAEFGRATHVVHAARVGNAIGAPEPVDVNLAMLRNLLDALEPVAPGLEHVHLVHGTKAYGANLGPFKTPAKEGDPRVLIGPKSGNMYYAQEDFIVERQRGKAWTWSISRPAAICDHAQAQCLSRIVAIYATVCRELGLPLYFPGSEANFHALRQMTDADLLAKAVVWMSTTPACANQAFNVTNGDYMRWSNFWPGFADWFGMAPGPVRHVRLADAMADKGPVWDRLVARHGLAPTPFEATAAWGFGDLLFAPGWDNISHTVKARSYGFDAFLDTEAMFYRLFERFRADRLIP